MSRSSAKTSSSSTERMLRVSPAPSARVLSFYLHPLSVHIETPAGGRGGCSRMTELSPTARVAALDALGREDLAPAAHVRPDEKQRGD